MSLSRFLCLLVGLTVSRSAGDSAVQQETDYQALGNFNMSTT